MTSELMKIAAAYLHVIGVAVYLGGAVIMEFVVGPAQKSIPPAQAMVLGQKVADRFLVFAWSALGLILASGLLRIFTIRVESFLFGENVFSTPYGKTLLTMVCLWGVLVVNGAIITFVLRPKLSGRMAAQVSAGQAQSTQDAKLKAAKWTTWLTRVDLGVAFVIALLGVSLAQTKGTGLWW
ncbi:MAG: hypothetical protein DYH08_10435 [Actinobacteria bacterium ATB1]|nr:hypothetical protein [Actinobacteria bacterium ATB1]